MNYVWGDRFPEACIPSVLDTHIASETAKLSKTYQKILSGIPQNHDITIKNDVLHHVHIFEQTSTVYSSNAKIQQYLIIGVFVPNCHDDFLDFPRPFRIDMRDFQSSRIHSEKYFKNANPPFLTSIYWMGPSVGCSLRAAKIILKPETCFTKSHIFRDVSLTFVPE